MQVDSTAEIEGYHGSCLPFWDFQRAPKQYFCQNFQNCPFIHFLTKLLKKPLDTSRCLLKTEELNSITWWFQYPAVKNLRNILIVQNVSTEREIEDRTRKCLRVRGLGAAINKMKRAQQAPMVFSLRSWLCHVDRLMLRPVVCLARYNAGALHERKQEGNCTPFRKCERAPKLPKIFSKVPVDPLFAGRFLKMPSCTFCWRIETEKLKCPRHHLYFCITLIWQEECCNIGFRADAAGQEIMSRTWCGALFFSSLFQMCALPIFEYASCMNREFRQTCIFHNNLSKTQNRAYLGASTSRGCCTCFSVKAPISKISHRIVDTGRWMHTKRKKSTCSSNLLKIVWTFSSECFQVWRQTSGHTFILNLYHSICCQSRIQLNLSKSLCICPQRDSHARPNLFTNA